jgi:hypothetical protein
VKGKRWLEDRGTMAKVKKRVLAFSRETNQAMMSHIVLRIKSLVEVTWSHKVNYIHGNDSNHMLKACLLKEMRQR